MPLFVGESYFKPVRFVQAPGFGVLGIFNTTSSQDVDVPMI